MRQTAFANGTLCGKCAHTTRKLSFWKPFGCFRFRKCACPKQWWFICIKRHSLLLRSLCPVGRPATVSDGRFDFPQKVPKWLFILFATLSSKLNLFGVKLWQHARVCDVKFRFVQFLSWDFSVSQFIHSSRVLWWNIIYDASLTWWEIYFAFFCCCLCAKLITISRTVISKTLTMSLLNFPTANEQATRSQSVDTAC